MIPYVSGIWASRYFWIHLALSDVRAKWRRSFLGVLWSILQPLGMTALLSVVFSRLFKQDFHVLAPYILSGMLVWEFVTSVCIGSTLAFVQADAYIKQCRHPLAIYTLRSVLANLIVLALASISLLSWILLTEPGRVSWPWLAATSVFPILVLITWPLATILAYFGARFRDLQHAMGLLLQAMWFVSPIYFDVKLFRDSNLNALVDYNPIYHLLEIVRAPLLRGEWPEPENYFFCLTVSALLFAVAWAVGNRAEPKVIFYL